MAQGCHSPPLSSVWRLNRQGTWAHHALAMCHLRFFSFCAAHLQSCAEFRKECADHAAALETFGLVSNQNMRTRWTHSSFDSTLLLAPCDNVDDALRQKLVICLAPCLLVFCLCLCLCFYSLICSLVCLVWPSPCRRATLQMNALFANGCTWRNREVGGEIFVSRTCSLVWESRDSLPLCAFPSLFLGSGQELKLPSSLPLVSKVSGKV